MNVSSSIPVGAYVEAAKICPEFDVELELEDELPELEDELVEEFELPLEGVSVGVAVGLAVGTIARRKSTWLMSLQSSLSL